MNMIGNVLISKIVAGALMITVASGVTYLVPNLTKQVVEPITVTSTADEKNAASNVDSAASPSFDLYVDVSGNVVEIDYDNDLAESLDLNLDSLINKPVAEVEAEIIDLIGTATAAPIFNIADSPNSNFNSLPGAKVDAGIIDVIGSATGAPISKLAESPRSNINSLPDAHVDAGIIDVIATATGAPTSNYDSAEEYDLDEKMDDVDENDDDEDLNDDDDEDLDDEDNVDRGDDDEDLDDDDDDDLGDDDDDDRDDDDDDLDD